jgi:ubiquinone/menaquinone biosynthesis C-methylase UbiE
MNFDRVAWSYRWLEYVAFGRALERSRFVFLDGLGDVRRALIIGDGDGRFTAALALRNRTVHIDSIELSGRMIRLASGRLIKQRVYNPDRIRLIEGDIRSVSLPNKDYDLVATHFVFDVFRDLDVRLIVGRVHSVVSQRCSWAVSEFDIPQHGWRRAHAASWVKTMYFFFRFAARLDTPNLPNWRAALEDHGFACIHSETARAGLIRSELWQLAPGAMPLRKHPG